jgi:hypothetical protein
MGTLTPPNDSASAARFLPSAECSLLGFVGQTSFFQIPEIRSNQTEKQISSALSSPRRACRTPLGAACSSAGPPTPARVTPRCPRSRWTNRPMRPRATVSGLSNRYGGSFRSCRSWSVYGTRLMKAKWILEIFRPPVRTKSLRHFKKPRCRTQPQ